MQGFVKAVVENYIIFLFFEGLLIFSLFRVGEKSRKKRRAVLILTLLSAVIWAVYYLVYIGNLPNSMAFAAPGVILVLCILLRRTVFPFKTHCADCGKALSITEFLSCDEHLCHECYEKKHPESRMATAEETMRRETEEKKRSWIGWRPQREFVIVFAADAAENVLLIDHTGMGKTPGKLSGAIGKVTPQQKMVYTATATLKRETGLVCEEPDYMARLNFEMPDGNLRFHVFIARHFSGRLKENAGNIPVWMPLKKLKYDLMSMDYPLWLPRTVRGQSLEYYARVNAEGKIYEDVLDLDAVIELERIQEKTVL